MFQETRGEVSILSRVMGFLFRGWKFLVVDGFIRYGLITMGCNMHLIICFNSWDIVSGLDVEVHPLELNRELLILNVYGHCRERNSFRGDFFLNRMIQQDSLILGGDIKFSKGVKETWCPRSHIGPLPNYFVHKLEEGHLLDIDSIKLNPT